MKRKPRLTRREQRVHEQRLKDAAALPTDGLLVSCEQDVDGWYIVFTKRSGEQWDRVGPFESPEDAYDGLKEVAAQGGLQLCESLAEAQKRN